MQFKRHATGFELLVPTADCLARDDAIRIAEAVVRECYEMGAPEHSQS